VLEFYCSSRGVARPAPKDWAFYLALSIFRLLAILAGNKRKAFTGIIYAFFCHVSSMFDTVACACA
jgi:aminoglycoside phosphotransferase (APT) family kinase protein